MSEKLQNSEIGYYNNQLKKYPHASIEDLTEDYGKDSEAIMQSIDISEKIELNRESILSSLDTRIPKDSEIIFHNEKAPIYSGLTHLSNNYAFNHNEYGHVFHTEDDYYNFVRLDENLLLSKNPESDKYVAIYQSSEVDYSKVAYDEHGNKRAGESLNVGTYAIWNNQIDMYLV